MTKPIFLLSKSIPLPRIKTMGSYDETVKINTFTDNGRTMPTVLYSGLMVTQSKTFTAPGDDDPDADAERCY